MRPIVVTGPGRLATFHEALAEGPTPHRLRVTQVGRRRADLRRKLGHGHIYLLRLEYPQDSFARETVLTARHFHDVRPIDKDRIFLGGQVC